MIAARGEISVYSVTADSPCYDYIYGVNDADAHATCADQGVMATLQ